MVEFTNIPLTIVGDASPAMERSRDTLEQSIDSTLDLIVFTPRGRFIADPEFGFEYWNHEFANINVREFNNSAMVLTANAHATSEITRRQCEQSLKESILAYEPRLRSPEVRVELDVNTRVLRRNMQSKYEMRIHVSGAIDDGLGVSRPYEKRISFMVEPVAHKINI